jgi:DNA polymerase-3 subunit gamma/tau
VSGAAPSEAPGAASDQAAAPPPGGGSADFDSVSQRWPQILDAVKGQRRVAWMLLSNAAVHSVEDGVLTIRFAREGDVKGFSSSGCDRDLSQVMVAGFGLKLQIKAVSAAQLGAGPAGSTAGEHSQVSGAAGHAQRGQPEGAGSDPDWPEPAGFTAAGPGSAQSGSPQHGHAQPDRAESGHAGSDAAQPGQGSPYPAQPPSTLADPRPSDMGPAAAAGRADLTGMDLIKRELGGKIIAEIDEA